MKKISFSQNLRPTTETLLRIGVLAIFLASSQLAFSQYDKNLSPDSTLFSLEVSSNAFFENLEFFNNIQEGYTLTGYNLEPRMAYAIGEKVKFSSGAHLLYFSGEDQLTRFVPVLTIQLQLAKSISFNVGTINNNHCHGLPEPIFKPERKLINQPENGFQLLFNGKFFTGDTWINWEKQIFHGDTIQEEFTAGFSGRIALADKGIVDVEIPLYGIAVHQGGQINVSNQPVSTLANFGSGINFSYPINSKTRFGAEGIFLLTRDLSPNPHHIFKKGWAIYPQLFLKSNLWILDVGYWKGSKLTLPRGQEIFGSVSTLGNDFNMPERHLITSNFTFTKKIAKGFGLSFGANIYYDIKASTLDYRVGMMASFDESFLILHK